MGRSRPRPRRCGTRRGRASRARCSTSRRRPRSSGWPPTSRATSRPGRRSSRSSRARSLRRMRGEERPATRGSLLVLVAVAGIVAVAGAAIVIARAAEYDHEPALVQPQVERCRALLEEAARDCYTRAFQALVADRDDPRPAVQEIAALARSPGGFLASNCHGIMHTVGRTYARDADVTLATLMEHLPRTNDPGCSAGFAHGLVSGVAPL